MEIWAIAVKVCDILAATATVVALIYLAKQTRSSTGAMQTSQELMNLEMNREERVLREMAQAHANGVTCWPAILMSAIDRPWGMEIMNRSSACIYNVSIVRTAGLSGSKVAIKQVDATAAVLAPGRYFVAPGEFIQPLMDGDETKPIIGNIAYMAEIAFADANGAEWVRDIQGSLKKLPAVPRAQAIPGA